MSQMDTRGAGGPGLRWCALCRSEYVAGVLECTECAVVLVDAPPLTPEEVGDEDGDQLAYELDDVDAAERYAIDRELAEHGIVHAWDGTTLVVAPWDEEEVERVLQGEDEHDLDGDEDQLVYDIADWDAGRRADLAAELDAAGIAHAFDEHGDLVVMAADEERVDELVEAVEFPDQLDAEPDGAGALDAVELLGSLFVAADRLKNDPTDSEGTIAAADASRAMATMPPPFGFAPALWDELTATAAELRRLLETETETVDDDAVVEAATKLRSALRPYV